MSHPLLAFALAAALPALAAGAAAHEGHAHHHAAPQGPAAAYAFPLAEPGSYRLPPIRRAADGAVLAEDGSALRLGELLRGRVSVFSFIYTRCATLCPLATQRLADLHDLAAAEPALADRLRLVSLSFDPEHDSPAVMADYGALWREAEAAGPEWLFLTTAGAGELQPILAAYDQAVDPAADAELNHVLRVFLVDAEGMVRNIYSLDFLDPALVLNDVATLLLER